MTFIYHIATASAWAQAQQDGHYTMSTLDRTLAQEGFIHASVAEQVTRVANAFYRGQPDLVLLVIDPALVEAEIRYEPAGGQPLPYPHIYGPLNLGAVVRTRPFTADPDGQFSFDPAEASG